MPLKGAKLKLGARERRQRKGKDKVEKDAKVGNKVENSGDPAWISDPDQIVQVQPSQNQKSFSESIVCRSAQRGSLMLRRKEKD